MPEEAAIPELDSLTQQTATTTSQREARQRRPGRPNRSSSQSRRSRPQASGPASSQSTSRMSHEDMKKDLGLEGAPHDEQPSTRRERYNREKVSELAKASDDEEEAVGTSHQGPSSSQPRPQLRGFGLSGSGIDDNDEAGMQEGPKQMGTEVTGSHAQSNPEGADKQPIRSRGRGVTSLANESDIFESLQGDLPSQEKFEHAPGPATEGDGNESREQEHKRQDDHTERMGSSGKLGAQFQQQHQPHLPGLEMHHKSGEEFQQRHEPAFSGRHHHHHHHHGTHTESQDDHRQEQRWHAERDEAFRKAQEIRQEELRKAQVERDNALKLANDLRNEVETVR